MRSQYREATGASLSNELTIVETDTRIGALKHQAHWSIVVASTGAGLTFTWLAHLMAWTPLGFAIHGVAGAVGGYLVGTGLSRALTGTRAQRFSGLEKVSTRNRIAASGLRIAFGTIAFYISYLWAVGVDVGVPMAFDVAMIGPLMPFLIWGVILGGSLLTSLIRGMR